jgi:hypothetical protein
MNNESVIFYRTNNVCKGEMFAIKKGNYKFGDGMWQPQLARIEPLTTLTIYYSNDKKDFKIYNNPYSDRYVVIKLQPQVQKTIYADVSSFLSSQENTTSISTNFLSLTDAIVIVILLFLFILVSLKH